MKWMLVIGGKQTIDSLYLKSKMKIQLDKKLHFIVSLIIMIGTASLLAIFTVHNLYIISTLVTLFIGVMKEVYDEYYGSGFSWGDILANIIGTLAGAGLIFITTLII